MENNTNEILLDVADASEKTEVYTFGMLTFQRLGKILKIIFSDTSTVLFILLLCVLALLEQYLVYNVGIIPSGFYKVLGDKDWFAFWSQVTKAVLLILAICFVISCKDYVTNVYYVTSRETLTDKLHDLYFKKNKFYVLNTLKYCSNDNPDQRIAQDSDKFCKQFSTIVNPIVISPFTISYYSYNCYQTTGWIGPTSIFLIFLVSVAINRLLINPIMRLVIHQEKCEGYFRFKHMHVRSNAESIALQGANIAEMYRCDLKLLDLIKTQQSLYLRQFPLDVSVKIFSYIGSIVSYLILAYPIFLGKFDNLTPPELSALISQNAFVSIYLISCFSKLIDISQTVSEIAGLTHRVGELIEALQADIIGDSKLQDEDFKLQYRDSDDVSKTIIELKNVTFSAPKESTPIVRGITLEVNTGENLLITGKSGSGKTSLLRIIKGLWPVQEGEVVTHLSFWPSNIFFLPQHFLLTDGSLIDQILFPLLVPSHAKLKDKYINKILHYLKFVELDHILQKAGLFDKVEWNWYDILSPGEAQRLSFVRLFCHKPKIAFLDEATSALGLEIEEKIYQKCSELKITTVSIGHRTSLVKFHDKFLHLENDGSWSVSIGKELIEEHAS